MKRVVNGERPDEEKNGEAVEGLGLRGLDSAALVTIELPLDLPDR
jgi:hypothetical protein